jgi:hypothetical protein
MKASLIEILDKAYEENMIWFILGSLISSENFMVPNNELPSVYKTNIDTLKRMSIDIESTKIPEKEKVKIKKYIDDGIELLSNEFSDLSKNN